MKKRKIVLIVLTCCAVSVGFADCGFVAGEATYKLKTCPSKDFSLPNAVRTENLEISRALSEEKDATNTYTCRKLVRYHIKERVNMRILLNKVEWSESDNYIGIVRDQGCSLIVATSRVSPNLPKNTLEREVGKWGESTKDFVNLLFKNTPYLPEGAPEKVELIGGKSEYVDWCKKLTLIELPESK